MINRRCAFIRTIMLFLFFLLTADTNSDFVIRFIERSAMRFIKKYLNSPQCATQADGFHLEILNFPFLPNL